MAGSIREFGFCVPVLARSAGDIIDGHLRLKGADKLGMTEIPVIVCGDLTEAQVKAFRLLVNRSVTWAEWDPELSALEMLDRRNPDLIHRRDRPRPLCLYLENQKMRHGRAADPFRIGRCR
jgi:hypothetical protein